MAETDIHTNPSLLDETFMAKPILKDERSRGWCEPTPRKGQRDADKHCDHKRRCDVSQKPTPSHSVRRFTITHNCPRCFSVYPQTNV